MNARSEEEVQHLLEGAISQLKEKGMRITATRKAILEYLIRSRNHPSVEEIYNDLRPQITSLSLATVYNNLNVLVEEGIVHEMKFTDITSRYDFHGHEHYHIICTKCGKIADFDFAELDDATQMIMDSTGYTVYQSRLEVYGLCPKCQALVEE